jgi:hypothetical protein
MEASGLCGGGFGAQIRCVYSALVINVESKLYAQHEVVFKQNLNTIFGGILQNREDLNCQVSELLYSPETKLTLAISQYLSANKFYDTANISQKLKQLDMLLNQRIGVAVIGPSSSGKSKLILSLKNILENLGKKIQVYRLNPRMFSKESFFGVYHPDTFDFEDGAFVSVLRQINNVKASDSFGKFFYGFFVFFYEFFVFLCFCYKCLCVGICYDL